MMKLAGFAVITLVAATTTAVISGGGNAVESASPGDRIVLPASEKQAFKIIGKVFNPPITIDASKAVFSSIVIRDSSGVHIKGGTVIGPGGRSYGIHVDRSRDISLDGMTITGSHRGMVIGASENVVVANNRLVGLVSDGIDLPQSRRVLVLGNSCTEFAPTPAIYDTNGKRLKDGDHPDCIQAWSRPGALPVADIKILNNRAEGRMQGIFFGNHVRNGTDDGGFDRIVIEGNVIRVSSFNGISLNTARDSIIRNNRISTVPGAAMFDGRPITARINIKNATNVLACGNTVDNPKVRTGTEACPR